MAMTKTDDINDPYVIDQAEKVIVKSHQQYKNINIQIYCMLNAELNIILLHRNKQHLESSIIKWGCRLLNENFHLVLMFTYFGTMQSCIGLNIHWAKLHFGTRLTSTCLQSRHLHAVEIYTRTMVFWISLPHISPHFGDWYRPLDTCHMSESSNHRTW